MATQAILIEQGQQDLFETIRSLDDLEVINKIKKYIKKLTAAKPAPLYSPENVAAVKQAYEECKAGKCTRLTDELKQHYFGDL